MIMDPAFVLSFGARNQLAPMRCMSHAGHFTECRGTGDQGSPQERCRNDRVATGGGLGDGMGTSSVVGAEEGGSPWTGDDSCGTQREFREEASPREQEETQDEEELLVGKLDDLTVDPLSAVTAFRSERVSVDEVAVVAGGS